MSNISTPQITKAKILEKLKFLQNEAIKDYENKNKESINLVYEDLNSRSIISNIKDFRNLAAEFEARLCTICDIHKKIIEFSDNFDIQSFKSYLLNEINYYRDTLSKYSGLAIELKKDFHPKPDFYSLYFYQTALDLVYQVQSCL